MVLEGEGSGHVDGEQLRAVQQVYDYAYLHARVRAGLRLERRELTELSELSRLLEGDSRTKRRRHRRLACLMPALLKSAAGHTRATVFNLSGGGMFVATREALEPGEAVQVIVGREREVLYTFIAEVTRRESRHGIAGVGLVFRGTPLVRRYRLSRSAESVAA
ncbi:MAG: PilZ domain-containing protein [Deltaproteobacteria bacterium]|nr:PilZ domain-containing protein [Deltaproteobacteria bacterium]